MACCNGRTCEGPTSADDYALDKNVINAQYQDSTMKYYWYGGCPFKVRGAVSPYTGKPEATFRYNRKVAPARFTPDWWQWAPVDFYTLMNKVIRFLKKNPRTNTITVQYNQHQVTYDILYVCREDRYLVQVHGALNARRASKAKMPEEMLRVWFALLYLSRYDATAPERLLRVTDQTMHYTNSGVTWNDKYWQWKCPMESESAVCLTQLLQLLPLLPRTEVMGDDPCLNVCFISQRDTTNLWIGAPRVVLHTVHADSVRAEPTGLLQMIEEQTHRYRYFPVQTREHHFTVPSEVATPDLVHAEVLE
jgi:hypothetical protein